MTRAINKLAALTVLCPVLAIAQAPSNQNVPYYGPNTSSASGGTGNATKLNGAAVPAGAGYLGSNSTGQLITSPAPPPTGTASGDLSGTYPAPTVAQVNGAAVPASAPCVATNGSSQFVATTCGTSGGPPTGTASGDLSGTYPAPTVAKVNGAAVPVSASYLGSNSSGQVVAAAAPTATGTAGGDLTGTYPSPTVAKVNGAAVPVSAPLLGSNASGQVIAGTAPVTSVDARTGAVTGLMDLTATGTQTSAGAFGEGTQHLAASGTSTAPGESWAAAPADGWFRNGTGDYQMVVAGNPAVRVSSGFIADILTSGWGRCWGSSGVASADTCIWRGGAGVMTLGGTAAGSKTGQLGLQQIVGNGTATFAAGAGAGGTVTQSVAGNSISGVISLQTTASGTASSVIGTLTYGVTLASAPKVCTLAAQNAATAGAMPALFYGVPTTTTVTLNSTTTALPAGTYLVGYVCV